MKRFLLLLVPIIMGTMTLWGTTVQVGSGTTTDYVVPIYAFYGYSYSQQIYTQAQIATLGQITKVRFYYSSGTYNNSTNWTVYLGHTAKTSFSSTTDWVPSTSMTQVFSGEVTFPAAGNWLEITLTTPFDYNNTDNLVVAVDENTDDYADANCMWRVFTSGANTGIYYRSDATNPDPSSPPTATGTSGNLAQIQFEMTITTPALTVAPSSLSFGYVAAGGTSTEQTYVLSGINLTAGPIVVTAPSGFQVSLTSGSGFGSSVNVSYTPPTLVNTTIYVRFAPTTLETDYSGNITNVGGGASKNVAVTGSSDLYAKYCTSKATTNADEDIFNVTLGTLNNTSDCSTTGGVGSVLNMYSNYSTTVAAPNLEQGSSNAFSVQIGTCGTGSYGNAVKIFIDFNKDGDFDDAGELVYVSAATTAGAHTETGNIAVPGSATLGNTLMRVVNKETADITSITACGTYSWGETEDYLVNIVVATLPTLAVLPISLDFGTTVPAGGTSAEQTYTLSGTNLTPASGNITVTPPANFQISLTSGSGFSSSPINVPYSGGALASKTIYVVFKPTSPATPYSGNILNAGGGATTVNVAVSGQSACGAVTVPYSQSFDGTTFPPICWSLINNGTGNQWTRATSGTYLGAGVMQYTYNSTSAADAWAFTPELTLQNGKVYKITFWQKVQSAGFPEKLKVTVGNAPTVAAQTTVLWNNAGGTNLTNTTYEKRTADYTCTATGSYYFAFNCYSDADQWLLFVDEVSIAEPPANDVGTFSIDVASSILSGTINPQATVKNFGTATNSFNVQMTITGGYSSTKAVTSLAPGTTTPVTFDPWSPAVGSDYTVKVWTQLVGDADASNDTLTKVVGVYNGVWSNGAVVPSAGKTYMGSGVGYTVTTAEATNGYLFSVGGNTTSGLGTECYKYDVNADTWTAIASLPAERIVLATAIVGDYLYAIGGSDGVAYLSIVYKYDIAGNSWSTVASLPITIGWGKAVGYNNKIYLAGGVDAISAGNYLSSVYVYDVATNTWSSATAMPGPKMGGAFSVADGKLVYAAGGNATAISSDVYVGTISPTNPLSITWITAESKYPGLPEEGISIANFKDAVGSIARNGKEDKESEIRFTETNYPPGVMYKFDAAPWGCDGIIMAGGNTGSPDFWTPANPNPCYIYKPATDTWIKQANVPTPVLGHSLGSVNMGTSWKLLVATGYTGTTTDVTQIYTTNTKSLNFVGIIEGFYSGSPATMVPDVVSIELRNPSTPYKVVEKCKVQLDASGSGTGRYLSVENSTNYYIAVKHRNAVETWSKNTQAFSSGILNYNFTTSAAQAYGDNMILKLTKYCFFSGDVNQDGVVDLTDVSNVDTDNLNFVTGYTATDINGDGLIDVSDLAIVDTNNLNFVSKQTPGGVVLGKRVKSPVQEKNKVENN